MTRVPRHPDGEVFMAVLVLTSEPDALRPLIAELGSVVLEAMGLSPGLSRLDEGWELIIVDGELGAPTLPLVERLTANGHAVAVASRMPTLQLTLQATSHGAVDVLGFPPEAARLLQVLESRTPPGEPAAPSAGAAAPSSGSQVIGQSRALLEAFRTVARVADSTATVLIRGESGTGKELLARVLHEQSSRAQRAFVAVNCAAIPENLLESELFGHERGAFTGALARRIGRIERASGGTLFLDEIGDMSLALQAKILRALQEREVERVGGEAPIRVDIRLIAATNRDLEGDVRSGRFREDLYYRLAVVPMELPPLRARDDDVRLLAEYYLCRAAADHGRPACRIDPGALRVLRAYSWPGNVRQLRNAMERAALLADGPVVRAAHLPAEIRNPGPGGAEGFHGFGTLADMEKRYIQKVLDQTGGHMAHAAEILGIHRNTLRRKLEAYGLA
jgi:two-component system, NtrC family, response regulator AtoC